MGKKAIAEEVSNDITAFAKQDWNYRWNDTTVSADEYKTLVRDHQEWLEQLEKKAAASALAEKPKRTKKNT
jgi:uncharacterized protein involved in tolerance to divalent cations